MSQPDNIDPRKTATLSAQDHLDILSLYAAYNRTIDTGQSDAWVDTFTVNGVFDHPSKPLVGREQIAAFIRPRSAALTSHPVIKQRHWNADINVGGDGQRATGTCLVQVTGVDRATGKALVLVSGAYEDSLIKEGAQWRFERRKLRFDPAS
ncbi:MAG: nuclear transport factor 2 family protein [Burkholderiaceae bacterium]|nr:nuclear transport factor 2 family protein [Desulfobacterales bacterium]MDP3138068.1 nuclear transport factor 2 family protein [Burkholderiaceae bacterium]